MCVYVYMPVYVFTQPHVCAPTHIVCVEARGHHLLPTVSSPSILRQALSLNMETSDFNRLVVQWTIGILLFLFPRMSIPNAHSHTQVPMWIMLGIKFKFPHMQAKHMNNQVIFSASHKEFKTMSGSLFRSFGINWKS